VFSLPHAAPHACDSAATQGITNDSSDSTTFWIGSKAASKIVMTQRLHGTSAPKPATLRLKRSLRG
jgi:hypothetical protein